MNTLVDRELPLLEQTLSLRAQLLDVLTDADLAHALPGNPSLGELCREAGQLDEVYVNSFRTFVADWDRRGAAPQGAETSLSVLRGWYSRSDAALKDALGALSEEEVQGRQVDRGGYKVPVGVQFHIYRESILIFCAKASVYLRSLGRSLPEQWQQWIG